MHAVSIVKGNDRYGNILKALELLDLEIPQDSKVLIKPNYVDLSNSNAVSHPLAVKAVVDFASRYNPRGIVIAENPCTASHATAYQAFKKFGLYGDMLKGYDVGFLDLNDHTFVHGLINFLRYDGQEMVADLATLEDYYKISLTLPKTHDMLKVTGSLKNMMGCLLQQDKKKIHGLDTNEDFSKLTDEQYVKCVKVANHNLAELIEKIRPDLSVIDGYHGMEGNGPIKGDLVELGIAIAGEPFAVDATSMRIMGIDPKEVGYMFYCQEKGLCNLSANLDIVGENPENLKRKFGLHEKIELQNQWR